MTFPVDAGRAATADASFHSGGHTINLPASVAAGDLLICALAWSAAPGTFTGPVGWTRLWNGYAVMDRCSAAALTFDGMVYFRIADGTEGATISVSTTSSIGISAIVWRITGHGHSNDWPPEFIFNGDSTGPPNPDSLDPYGWEGPQDVLWLAIGAKDAQSITGTPTNYSNVTGAGPTGAAVSVRGSSRQLNAISEDPPAYTQTVNSSVWAATIAIKPAANDSIDHSPEEYGMGQPMFTVANVNVHTVPLPGGLAAGDRCILGWSTDLAAGTPTVTTPTGWTLFLGPVTNGNLRAYYWYRDCDGTEGRSVTINTSGGGTGGVGSNGWVKRIKGYDSAVAPEGTATTGTSATPDPPSHSPSWGVLADSLFIATAAVSVGAVTGQVDFITGTPAGYEKANTTRQPRSVGGSTTQRVASRELTASSENPAAFGAGSSLAWIAATIAVKGGSGGLPAAQAQVWIS